MGTREDVYRQLSTASVPDSIKRKLLILYDLISPVAFNYYVDRLTRFTEEFTRAHARPAELGNITNASFVQRSLLNLPMTQRWRGPGVMVPCMGGSVLNASIPSRATDRLQPDEYIRVNGIPEESDEMEFDEGNKENSDVRNRYEPGYRRSDPRMLSYTPDPPKANHPGRLGACVVPRNSKGKKKTLPVSEESDESSEESDESSEDESPQKKKRNTLPKKSRGTPVDSSRKESQQKRATKHQNDEESTSELSAKKKKSAPARKEKKKKPQSKKSPKEKPVPEERDESEESSEDESPQKKPKEVPKRKTPKNSGRKKRNSPKVPPCESLGESSRKESPPKKVTKQQYEQNNEASSSKVSAKKKKPAPKEKKQKPPPKKSPKEPTSKKTVEEKEKSKLEKTADKMSNKLAFDDSDEGSLSSFLRSAKKHVQELATETPPTRALNSVIMEFSESESSDEAATPVSKPKNKKWVARISHMKDDKNLNNSPEGKKPKSKKRPAPVSKEVEKLVEAATSRQLRTPEPLKRGFENTQETVSDLDGYGSSDSS